MMPGRQESDVQMVKLTTSGSVRYKKNTKVISSFIENADSSGMVNFRNE
jgi:hypothetical protein